MSDKYEWLAMDGTYNDGQVWWFEERPKWNGEYFEVPDEGDENTIDIPPDWLLPGQLYKRGKDDDNSGCVYVFDGSLWTLEEDNSKPQYMKGEREAYEDYGVVDAVEHPKHYTAFPIEVIDIIKLCLDEIDRRELPLTSFQKSCFKDEIKYRFRAGLKGDNAAEDIKKAMKYMEFRNSV